MSDNFIRYSDSEGKKLAVIQLNEDLVGLSDKGSLGEIVKSEIAGGVNDFSFDFSGLRSLNSAGIGIIIGCRNSILAKGGSLKLDNVNDKITDIFKLTKIDGLFGLGK